jgi:GTP-binding protein EngB required for normal cell division/polyhydroxyalkanoate synthesis regulator phasin
MAEPVMSGGKIAEQQRQPAPVSAGSLRDYGRLKLELAAILRSLRQMAEARKDKDGANECRKLLSRLAEDRFNLVVVGQFSRGKTSLMNAMLGIDRLPTSVLPLTSVITSVSYGDRERVVIYWQWWSYTSEIQLSELPQYVTQEGNPGNERRVQCAEVQLPVELLRLGFYFIDTPGVGSAIAANTATTSAFLPEADAVIFLTSFESPLAEAELQFLDRVRRHVRKIFVVVNKRDLVPAEQQGPVMAFVEARLKDALGESHPHAYSISARDALSAKQSADAEKLSRSGLPSLEADLLEFLQKDKAREFLARVADRTSAVLSRFSAQFEVIRKLGTDTEKLRVFEADLTKRLKVVQQEREKIIRDLRNRLGSDIQRDFEAGLEHPVLEFKLALEQDVRKRVSSSDVFTDSLAPQLAADAHAAGKRISGAWLEEHKPEIQRVIEDAGRNALEQLKGALSELHRLGGGGAGDSQDSSLEARLGDILRENPAIFRELPSDLWNIEIPWWLELLTAVSPLKALVIRRCLAKGEDLARAYRDELVSLLRKAGDDWVEHLDRKLGDLIDDRVTAQRQMLQRQIQPEEVSNLERLRERLDALESAVDLMDSATASASTSAALDLSHVPQSNVTARCKICREVEAALFDFMRHRQYELSTSEKDQISHAEQGGYCGLHTWQYEAISSPQGVCSAYPPVLAALGRRLRALAESAASPGALIDGVLALIPDGGGCRACQLIATVERRATTKLVTGLTADEGKRTASLPPLCLRHLHSVLRSKPSADLARGLIEEQARVLDRLSEDMQKYVLKHDALRRELATELEHQVHEIALSRLVGLRSIVAPRKVDEI